MFTRCSRFVYKSLTSKKQRAAGLFPLSRAISFGLLATFIICANLAKPTFACCVPLQQEPKKHQDYLEIKRDYLLAIQAECLKKIEDPPATQQAFVKLHNKYLDVSAYYIKQHDRKRLYQDCQAFLKLKPQEPFSQIVVGQILMRTGQHTNVLENVKMIKMAAGKMKDYSLEARLYAAAAVHETVYETDAQWPKATRKIFHRHLDLLVEWMSQKDSPENLQRLMFEDGRIFINSYFKAQSPMIPTILSKLGAAKGKMKPWLFNVLMGEARIEQAWAARGSGFANSVEREGWVGFEKGLELAEKAFKAAYKLNPERPEAATGMIQIAMAGDTEEDERTWFDRAVNAEFDYLPAYSRYRQSLLPRWGGSHEALIEFGLECAATERYDTRVPLELALVINDVETDAKQRFNTAAMHAEYIAYLQKFDIVPAMLEVLDNYEKYIKQNDGFTVTDARFFRETGFLLTYRLEYLEDAYRILKKYDGDVLNSIHSSTGRPVDALLLSYIYAVNGAAAEQVKLIDEQTPGAFGTDRNLKESQALLAEVKRAAAANDLPQAELYFKTKQELLAKEIEFHGGDWVNLEFTPDLRHWTSFGGRHKVERPNSLFAAKSDKELQYLSYNASFPPPYEVQLTVECVKSNAFNGTLLGGVISGRMFGPQTGRFFWADTLKNKVGLAAPRKESIDYRIENVKRVTMRLLILDDYYEMYDGVGGGEQIADSKYDPGRIGIGQTPWLLQSGEIRYSNFRLRKLDPIEPPDLSDGQSRVEFYSKLLEKDENFDYLSRLAKAYYWVKQNDKAIETYQIVEKTFPKSVRPPLFIGLARLNKKDYDEVGSALERALDKCVNSEARHRELVLGQLISFYATCPEAKNRDGTKAVKYAKELQGLIKKNNSKKKNINNKKKLTWIQLDQIAAAFAEAGQFKKAVNNIQSAIKAAQKNNKDKIKGLREKLKLYQAKKPYHET